MEIDESLASVSLLISIFRSCSICNRNTVKNILKRGGYETGPNRGPGTWDDFLTRHAKTLWQCDFFSKKALTTKCLKDLYVLVFLHIGARQLFISTTTYHPDEAWAPGLPDDSIGLSGIVNGTPQT